MKGKKWFLSDPQSITKNFSNVYGFESSIWYKRHYISEEFVVHLKRDHIYINQGEDRTMYNQILNPLVN